jgi:hypothetical protein
MSIFDRYNMAYKLSFFERYTSTDPEEDRILKEQYNKGMEHGMLLAVSGVLCGAAIGEVLIRYYLKKN